MSKRIFIFLFLLPTLLTFFLLSIYPFIEAIRCSLTDENILKPRVSSFIGLKNYIRLLFDYRFINSLKVSITFLGLATLFSFLLGFILSLLIYKVGGKIYDLIMVIFLLPALSSRVAISLIWRWMYQPTIGIINYFMRLIKLQGLSWLYDPNTALMSILVVDIWQWAQFLSLLIITAIRSLPSNILEAAEVDGASEIQKIRYIMVPLLIPHFIGIIFIKALLSLRTFDLIWNMTRGGRVYPLK